jgi:hypothetical protein
MPAKPEISQPVPGEIGQLLRGDPTALATWSRQWDSRRATWQIMVIILGAGSYGAAMGWWRSPQQALFTAIKFPLIILLTTLGNALINGMLAPLLGLNLPFRQSLGAILMSFTITAAILGAFSPLLAFWIWSTPGMSPSTVAGAGYSLIKLMQVAVIALAGTTGSLRLLQALASLGGNRAAAQRVLAAWLAANLLLGSQLSWLLRPFIGSPALPVEFLRATAFHGNFYENIFRSAQQLLQHTLGN